MLMPKEMENVYLLFTWIISGEDNASSGETALNYSTIQLPHSFLKKDRRFSGALHPKPAACNFFKKSSCPCNISILS